MEPITTTAIVSGVISAVTSFLVKGGEKVAEKVVEEGFEQRGRIWQRVKSLFAGDELVTLNLFEKYPKNEDVKKEIEAKLEEKITKDPELSKEFESLLKQIPGLQGQTVITQSGENNTAYANFEAGQVIRDIHANVVHLGDSGKK
jgi:hypothetical protein